MAIWFTEYLDLKNTMKIKSIFALFFMGQIVLMGGKIFNTFANYRHFREVVDCTDEFISYIQIYTEFQFFMNFMQGLFILKVMTVVFKE